MDQDLQLPSFRTVRMTLIDTDVVHESEQDVKVFVSPLGVSLFADGYGTSNRILSPLFVTQQKGELLVFVNGDINIGGVTHVIRLGKAKETNRRRPVTDTR
ncbi:MAG TPA: hypothetical protein VHC22_13445 [Pirellulales bacterium]|nr:hypothetical protein [Pirellulales bacterium]